MWDLQGFLLYKSIERRNERDQTGREQLRDDMLIPYARRIRDPRVDPEEAKKIAA